MKWMFVNDKTMFLFFVGFDSNKFGKVSYDDIKAVTSY